MVIISRYHPGNAPQEDPQQMEIMMTWMASGSIRRFTRLEWERSMLATHRTNHAKVEASSAVGGIGTRIAVPVLAGAVLKSVIPIPTAVVPNTCLRQFLRTPQYLITDASCR